MTRIWRVKGDKILVGLMNLVKDELGESGHAFTPHGSRLLRKIKI